MNENPAEGVTADEYRQQVLKRNFATRCADYEEVIAQLQTRVAILEQTIKGLRSEDTETSALPPPPDPS